jgi:hypothetical protein
MKIKKVPLDQIEFQDKEILVNYLILTSHIAFLCKMLYCNKKDIKVNITKDGHLDYFFMVHYF